VEAAEVGLKYRPALGFWGNARRFHRRLRRAMRNPFAIYRLFSKAVPASMVRELGPLIMQIASRGRPFGITNLGALDGVQLQAKGLQVESFSGAVSSIVDSSVLTVFTIGGRMKLRFLATESTPADTSIRDEAERAVQRLLEAIAA
jgi:hypothetical protein